MKIFTDALADVHVGDTVRYVHWDYATRGKFYRMAGTVTELRGTGALGVHFPHYAAGTNLVAVADHFRLIVASAGWPAGPEVVRVSADHFAPVVFTDGREPGHRGTLAEYLAMLTTGSVPAGLSVEVVQHGGDVRPGLVTGKVVVHDGPEATSLDRDYMAEDEAVSSLADPASSPTARHDARTALAARGWPEAAIRLADSILARATSHRRIPD